MNNFLYKDALCNINLKLQVSCIFFRELYFRLNYSTNLLSFFFLFISLFISKFHFFGSFDTESYDVAQTVCKLMILLPQLPSAGITRQLYVFTTGSNNRHLTLNSPGHGPAGKE